LRLLSDITGTICYKLLQFRKAMGLNISYRVIQDVKKIFGFIKGGLQ